MASCLPSDCFHGCHQWTHLLISLRTNYSRSPTTMVVFSCLSDQTNHDIPKLRPTFKESHPETTPRQHVPSDVRILRFDAPLHFANVGRFTDSLAEEIESTKEQVWLHIVTMVNRLEKKQVHSNKPYPFIRKLFWQDSFLNYNALHTKDILFASIGWNGLYQSEITFLNYVLH